MRLTSVEARAAGVAAALAGLLHLVAPRALLRTASRAYASLLAVEFSPTDRAPRRVRLVGAALLLAGLAVARYANDRI